MLHFWRASWSRDCILGSYMMEWSILRLRSMRMQGSNMKTRLHCATDWMTQMRHYAMFETPQTRRIQLWSASEVLFHSFFRRKLTHSGLQQFTAYDSSVHQLPLQVRDAMEQIMRSNVQMYTMLRTIHSSILRSPAHQLADSIQFEDVLGRTKALPYEYFRHVEVYSSCSKMRYKAGQLDYWSNMNLLKPFKICSTCRELWFLTVEVIPRCVIKF
jgi:hypothetical protein